MKIWNMNKLSGIIGVFNCQGAGNWPLKQHSLDNPTPKIISDHVSPNDVEFLGEIAGDKWHGDCAVYSFNSGNFCCKS